MALKFPGEKSFPSPISVVSFTCCHFPEKKEKTGHQREPESEVPLVYKEMG